MTPNFPQINLLLNSFYECWEKKFAFQFSDSLRESDDDITLYSDSEHVLWHDKYITDLLELAEAQINQTVMGYNPTIIISLFQYIKSQRQTLYPIAESLREQLVKYNEESYNEYVKQVDRDTATYFNNEKFTGLKHLDEYDDYIPEDIFTFTNFKHVRRPYHAYYCVTQEWKTYFDPAHFNQYHNFLCKQADKLANLFDKYIVRHDEGEFTKQIKANSENERKMETRVEKIQNKAKNSKIITPIIITCIVLAGLATTLGNLRMIKEFFIPKKKVLSGIVKTETNSPLRNVVVSFTGSHMCRDTTDSFGAFHIPVSDNNGIQSFTLGLAAVGFPDTILHLKMDFDTELDKSLDIVLKRKSDRQLCEEGNVEACYRYANSIEKTCPAEDGRPRNACFMKGEMYRGIGEAYEDALLAKRDSGETSHAFIEAMKLCRHRIEMVNAVVEFK